MHSLRCNQDNYIHKSIHSAVEYIHCSVEYIHILGIRGLSISKLLFNGQRSMFRPLDWNVTDELDII